MSGSDGTFIPKDVGIMLPVTVTLYDVRQDEKEVEEVSYDDRQ